MAHEVLNKNGDFSLFDKNSATEAITSFDCSCGSIRKPAVAFNHIGVIVQSASGTCSLMKETKPANESPALVGLLAKLLSPGLTFLETCWGRIYNRPSIAPNLPITEISELDYTSYCKIRYLLPYL